MGKRGLLLIPGLNSSLLGPDWTPKGAFVASFLWLIFVKMSSICGSFVYSTGAAMTNCFFLTMNAGLLEENMLGFWAEELRPPPIPPGLLLTKPIPLPEVGLKSGLLLTILGVVVCMPPSSPSFASASRLYLGCWSGVSIC